MRFKDFFYLQEAISLSNARNMKLTRKNSGAYTKEVLNTAFEGKDRLIFPLNLNVDKLVEQSDVYIMVRVFLFIYTDIRHELTTDEYVNGVFEYNKNKYKIGRLIEKYKNDERKTAVNVDKLAEAFKKDPLRVNKSGDFYIVISRHPYDVAGSSTDRSWTSCMDLGFEHIQYKNKQNKEKPGINSSYVSADIAEGTIAAYVVPKDEVLPNGKVKLHRPLSRILIKPHRYRKGDGFREGFGFSVDGMYGNKYPEFRDFIKSWVTNVLNKNVSEVIKINNNLYDDSELNTREIKLEYEKDNGPMSILFNPDIAYAFNNPRDVIHRWKILKKNEEYIKLYEFIYKLPERLGMGTPQIKFGDRLLVFKWVRYFDPKNIIQENKERLKEEIEKYILRVPELR